MFTTSHEDKAIEIDEDRMLGAGRIKRFRRSLIIKNVFFYCLQEFIVTRIECRFVTSI